MLRRCVALRNQGRTARALTTLASLLGLLLHGCGGSGTSGQGVTFLPSATVGRFELEAPSSRDFVLRGTLPVPRSTYPRHDGLVPFAIRDANGELRPAQVEIVSRWPDEALGADVVEILARVQRPPQAAPGERIRYEIVAAPHAPGEFQVHAAAAALLDPENRLRLTARDVFGHEYVADLLHGDVPDRPLRDGRACREWRTVTNFVPVAPVSGPTGTLPHLMGVHAFFRVWAGEPVISLDLRIHNGPSGHDTADPLDDPMGKLYFESIDLWLPSGWNAWQADPDLFTGDAAAEGGAVRVPLVRALDGGKLHVMPVQAQTVRRLVLGRDEDEERALDYARDANLGFARRGSTPNGPELHSWWTPATARYFPQRQVLPRLDFVGPAALRAQLEDGAAWVSNALRNGTAAGYPIYAPAMGWAHPWGIDDGGMAGGDEIVLYDGLRTLEVASNAGWRVLAMRHRMLTDRQRVSLFDRDGRPTDYTSWTVVGTSGTWLPIWCFLTPILWAGDPFGFTTAPTFQVAAVAAQDRRPPYEAALLAFQPIDLEHLVRYTAPAKALAWLGNDTLAKEALHLHAALFRMSYNELPGSDYGHYISTGLGADQNYVAAHPGLGFTFGRMEAWGLDAATAWYALADPQWRGRARPWFERIADVVERGQSSCSGFIEAMIYEQLFDGQYRARQSIEQAITEHALVGLRETVMRGVDPARVASLDRILGASLRSMVTEPGWSTQHHAPWNKLAVGDPSFDHAPFCGPPPPDGTADGGDTWQCWSSLAYGYEQTGDPLFLQRAAEMVGGGDLLQALQAQGLWAVENKTALIALAQRLRD